ncbi:MAG: hypothetical protein C0504_06645 [Candidatus Solibacter sp.]|nr:hypothetical protein [Candidatus Solibacter sp.]
MSEIKDARHLIEAAFSRARQSGKADWWRMAIPVLKNRLLQMTNREFSETAYGARTFREFIDMQTETLRVEDAPHPGFVVLKSAESEFEAGDATSRRVPDVAPDLWRAMLDFSSGNKYVWDESRRAARQAVEGEDGLTLPSLTREELDTWREEFVREHPPEEEDSANLVDVWRTKRLPTKALPPALQKVWSSYLKGKVQARLTSWFAENHLAEPSREEVSARVGPPDQQVEQLRRFVITCVGRMTRQELEDLRISPAVALRAVKG